MNLLYCGDRKIEDGLIISILSFLEHTKEPLHIYVLTVTLPEAGCVPVTDACADSLNDRVSKRGDGSFVKRIDATEIFRADLPLANMDTRFTPCCMLRLYADEIPEIPDRILYVDNDVVCRRDIGEFYGQDLEGHELAGVLDHYGKWFFRQKPFRMDYLNSGVLLLDMKKIRESGLFSRCRRLCRDKKMFMPDQSAVNRLADKKVIAGRRYNEQRKLHKDTALQHFTTSFRFFPWLHTLTVKPWQTDALHRKLRIYEYDSILEEYRTIHETLQTNTEIVR